MNSLIYAYGNHEMGMGHVYRMSNIAKALTRLGYTLSFLMPDWGDGVKKISEQGFNTLRIPVESFEDEREYLRVLGDTVYDCIIVDALNVSENIMKAFREKTHLLVSIDHMGEGRLLSDILVNILYQHPRKLKKPKIELNSLNYMLLNENFKRYNTKKKAVTKEVKKIMITQGGSDTYGVVPKIIQDMDSLPPEIECFALTGPAFKHQKELDQAVKNSGINITVLKDVKEPWKIYSEMDLAITGGGMTLFELLCVGTPCIALTQELREMETINLLKEKNVITVLGMYDALSRGDISAAIKKLINDFKLRNKMSNLGKKSVDGKGIDRITKIITEHLRNQNQGGKSK